MKKHRILNGNDSCLVIVIHFQSLLPSSSVLIVELLCIGGGESKVYSFAQQISFECALSARNFHEQQQTFLSCRNPGFRAPGYTYGHDWKQLPSIEGPPKLLLLFQSAYEGGTGVEWGEGWPH